jgi:hypothetical protein
MNVSEEITSKYRPGSQSGAKGMFAERHMQETEMSAGSKMPGSQAATMAKYNNMALHGRFAGAMDTVESPHPDRDLEISSSLAGISTHSLQHEHAHGRYTNLNASTDPGDFEAAMNRANTFLLGIYHHLHVHFHG